MAGYFAKTRQRHRVIKKAVIEVVDITRLSEHNLLFRFSGHTVEVFLFTKQNKPSSTAVDSEIRAPIIMDHGR